MDRPINQFSDRFEHKTYENEPLYSIALFDNDIIKDSEINMPQSILLRIINLGKAYNLYCTSRIDLYDHMFFEKINCEHFFDELEFLKKITNDKLLHKHLENISRLTVECVKRINYKLLINS